MARIICFVCGSQGAEHRLRIKPYENEPYFPFLEHHDPPKGSRLPSEDGIVDSCRVCNAFLCQQWETYERSHTPAIKRLYWLKRADNGHFTGAEMRLQGEYIAQIMGLQYQPGSFDGRSSPHDISQDMRPMSARIDRKSAESGKERKTQPFSHSSVQQKVTPVARASVNVPVYNAVNRGIVNVPPKPHQMPDPLDLSVTKKSDNISKGNIKNETLLCFLCAQRVHLHESSLVNSLRQPNSEPYFPVVHNLPCLPGAMPLNEIGQARVCMPCKNSLYQQWQAYEMSGIPTQHRNYKIYESQELKILRAAAVTPQRMPHIDLAQTSSEHICYICGNIYPTELIRSLFTMPSSEPSMGTLFFPFVRDLSRPAGAEPLRSDGSVLACRNCYEALYKQWQLQEMERIPLPQRQYTLSFLGKKGDVIDTSYKIKQMKQEPDEISATEQKTSKSGLSVPLNIQISENSQETNNVAASEGLLAIASSSSSMNEEILIPKAKSPYKSNNSPSVDLVGKPIPHPLQQATEIPQKICFLCGEKCRLSKAHVLCSYPTRHEAKTLNSQVVPFFPFLANRDPAPRAEPMTEDGTVISCNVCFHILIQQWNEYEENKTGGDSNRWLRKYTLPDFVCCLCSSWMKHKNIQLISSKTFPFLKDIKPNSNAPTIEDGHTAGVCKSCANSLIQQNVEYERMGVPAELRKFNWMKQGEQAVQEEDICVDEEDDKFSKQQEKIGEYSKETNSSTQGISEDSAGSGQNVKPPPLNMLSGSKLPRNTATVPPLNQTSPSNGLNSISSNAALNATRTSSFAAALRKLAHQAKDPEDSPKHSSQPGSSTTSPRATTPKRGPPPLVYTSHSSLGSPPVVTIAPTQSHPSVVSNDSRQSIDRTHSVQSTSSAYDGLTSVKLDRPHSRQSGREEERYRPQSSHSSRDDDRLSTKEATIARRTPLSAQSSTSPAVTREETLMRGFQPYRPGDDLRHSLPPFGLDSAAYPYPAFLPPHAFPHPAFRFDDPLLLERYRMMQPHYLPFAHPGMLPPPGGLNPFLAGRYPPELLHQQLPFMSQSSRLTDHLSPSLVERQRLEEERIRDLEKEQREKEKEAILLREKERAREREKEYDKLRESMSHDYRPHHSTELRVPHHVDSRTTGIDLRTPQLSAESKKLETKDRNHNERGPYNSDSIPRSVEGHKYGSITHGTPRDFNLNEKSSREFQFNTDSHKSVRRDIESSKHSHHDASKHHSHHDRHGSAADHKDKKYSLLHSGHLSDKNKPKYESESKFHKSSDSIFRPFDTSSLTNGYLPTHRSRDVPGVTGSGMQNAERTIETGQGRLPKDNTENKSSALKYSVAASTKSGSFNLNHVIDASKMHYKEFHSEHLQSNFEKNRNLVVSRLDIGEQKLRERRQRGELSDDSEMDEIIDYLDESHKQNLLMVVKGPPLQLDASKEKMTFLHQLGLTSQKVKRDLEYKKIRRRRRRHREPSVSPILMVDGEEKQISPSPKLDPHVLCQEPDYTNKCSFLGSFSLGTVETEKKKGSAIKRKQDRKTEEHSGKKVPKTNRTEKVKLFPNKNGDKTLSQEFAQEFHNSVLQSTQQKQINGRLGLSSDQTGESSNTSRISQDSSADKIPKWPGIDVLMESYQRYQEEFKMEKTMLKDRCRNLQSSNQDLNKKAEDLSRKMSDSIEKKKLQEESRLKNQGAIASLKQILKDMK